MRRAEDAPQGRHPAEGIVDLQGPVALHAAIELRPHAQRVGQAGFEPAGHAPRRHAVVEQLAGTSQQAVDGVSAGPLLDGAVGQLAEVPGRGRRLQPVAQAQPGVGHVHGGDDVQVPTARQDQVELGEGLHAATDAAARTPHALGDGPELAVLRRQQGDDAVGLAEVEVGEHDGARLVGARPRHRREPSPADGLARGRTGAREDLLTTGIMFAC